MEPQVPEKIEVRKILVVTAQASNECDRLRVDMSSSDVLIEMFGHDFNYGEITLSREAAREFFNRLVEEV